MSRRTQRNPGSTGRGNRANGATAAVATDEPGRVADADASAWLGERLRRLALGLTTALVVSRSFWPSEPDYRIDAGAGLPVILSLLVVAGLAVAGPLISGRFRWRFSWADLGVVLMVAFIGVAAGSAADRRPAINMAWEWGAVGLTYILLRNLPRTRRESAAVVAALGAAAVSVAVYGLFHVTVELASVREAYLANREEALRLLGIVPGSPSQALYENRLLGSNEPTSTFGLANSLAGFLVGPLVVAIGLAWDRLTRPQGEGSRWGAVFLAVPPIGLVLYCLVLTKSRSAYLGLGVGLLILAWRERTRVRPRTLIVGAVAGALIVLVLVFAGSRTGRLDREVLTESGKSLRYRAEYWQGAWAVINESPSTFWKGHGPGNFSDPYARHKLPESSEEIKDPHNFLLEVWAAGGLRAVLALTVALGFGLWRLLKPSRSAPDRGPAELSDAPVPSEPRGRRLKPARDPDAPPAGAGWVVGFASLGWLLALPPLGGLMLFSGDLDRWLVLGSAWLVACGCGQALWRQQRLDAGLIGAAVVAILVNLVAAGGISVAAVAISLWGLMAVGLNLRDEEACGRLRESGGRIAGFSVAAVWVALLGTFVGAVRPYWKSEAAMLAAAEELDARGRMPDFDRVEALLAMAAEADPLSARPWAALASASYQAWVARGAKPDDLRWRKVPIAMYKTVSRPRNPDSWTRHRERARITSLLLKQLGTNLSPTEVTRYRADIVEASRRAVRLYPTNASLRAWLAEASAEIGMISDALKEGREALRLDAQTPHADKKLDPEVRVWLKARLPEWEKAVGQGEPPLPDRP